MIVYELEQVDFSYGATKVIDDLHLTFEAGHFYGIIGPNGCGKTTLIDLLTRHLRPDRGQIRLNGRNLDTYPSKALARSIALVPQDFRINFPYSCVEIVMMGRYPHIPRFSRPNAHDRELVQTILKQAALDGFDHRQVNQLSGGERQRVVFARSLVQNTPVLLLDEATSHLDMQHTLDLLELAAQRVSDRTLVIAVMQDINLAAMYCDRLVCLSHRGVFANGPVEQVLTPHLLQTVFRVTAQVAPSAYSGHLQATLKRKGRA